MQSSTSEPYDPQQQEVDRAEVNQLARMMPDPEEDELFDDGMLSPTHHQHPCSMVLALSPTLAHAVLGQVRKAWYTHHWHPERNKNSTGFGQPN